MVGLEPATDGSLQISGRTHKPQCHRRPRSLGNQILPSPQQVISGFQALRQARALVAGLKSSTEYFGKRNKQQQFKALVPLVRSSLFRVKT
ncbi:hypothetical protein PoB_007237700 [Plakobranchus ocellatus]|uniref:Uncharacterized protein n=1 Tax=Plakobranchus ocellatus TaxID=259542 RepID=A0AAV4DND9_9GAST|nr:hypothetical protein PoB_007237700 [Plakobranchus ocellatus]